MSTFAREILGKMPEDELQNLLLHLEWYALKKCRRLRWRSGNFSELPKGETVDSIVSLAFERLLNDDPQRNDSRHQRNWNPQKVPDLKKFLMGVIDSLINQLAESKDNALFLTAHEAREVLLQNDLDEDVAEKESSWMIGALPSPEDLLLKKEKAALDRRKFELLLAEIEDDPVLKAIVQARINNHEKPGEIAKVTGIPVKQIYNGIKKLDRKKLVVEQKLQEELNQSFLS